MTARVDTEVLEVVEDTDWHWRLAQPKNGADVVLELGTTLESFDGPDLQRVVRVIARKLQYVASMLLSHELEEGDE